MSVKKTIISIVIGIIIGFVGGIYYSRSHTTFEIPNDFVETENKKIDSLVSLIKEYELINSCLRDSVREVIITRTIEVDVVKKLPLDKSVEFLKQKLREYEEEY